MTRLAVDWSWNGISGIGRFAAEVLARVPRSVDLVRLREGQPNASALSPWKLATEFKASAANAFWSPGFMPAALPKEARQAVTVHDLLHIHFHSAAHRLYYDLVMRPLLRRLPLLFTVSEFSRRELIDWAGLRPERVVAIHHGLAPTFTAEGERRALDRPYLLYIGNRRAHKNLPLLIDAFANSRLAEDGVVLALSGDLDETLAARAQALGIGTSLRWLGVIAEADLAGIYRGALATAFVSRYEGFGFPIIESMGCGTPVITSSTSSMPEIAGGAALTVDPGSIDAVADGLRTICTDRETRDSLRRAGLARASVFNWDTCAGRYWTALETLVQSSSSVAAS